MALCSRCCSVLPQKSAIPGSPVSELIRTYRSPSSSQSSSTRQAISDAQSHIHELDNEILKLENALETLRRRRIALDCFTREHQAILAPIRRLPPEILGDIFNLCLHHHWQDRIFDVREAPLLLSQVCIGWRDIALSNARLWSTISIYLQDSFSKSELALVKTWLHRAAGHPLSIRIIDRWQRANHPVLDLIAACSDRWQHVEFEVAQSFIKNLNLGLSTLESASFPVGVGSVTPPVDAFLLAPRLHCLHMALPYTTQLPWSQLTELHVHAVKFEECLKMIRQSLNLISCELGVMSWNHMESIQPPTCRILLSQLRLLRVSASPHMGHLFDCLTLPTLLEIQLKYYETAWVDQFISLLHRSSCALQKLHLESDQHIPDDHLIRCLQSTPSLNTLELRGYHASNLRTRGMIQLTHRASSHQKTTCIVPNLRTIKLQYTNNSTFDDGAFVDVIASRWGFDAAADGQVTRLKTAHVSVFHHAGDVISEETVKRLRTFRDEGLDIRLVDEHSGLSLL